MGGERQGVGMVMRSEEMMGSASMIAAVTSVLSIDDARGKTVDDIASALKLPAGGAALQAQLEALVRRGVLTRRGISRGALYALATPARVAQTLRPRARMRTRQNSMSTMQGATV